MEMTEMKMNMKIPTYTINELGMNSGDKYLLPFKKGEDVNDENVFQKTVELFTGINISGSYDDKKDKNETNPYVNEYGEIEIKRLYEGDGEYYPFKFRMDLFKISYDDTKWKKKMLNDPNIQQNMAQMMETLHILRQKRFLKKDDGEMIEDGQWFVSLFIDQEEHPLLEELIELKCLPSLIKNSGLKKYTYAST